jgi:predicted RNase H-like nuclease
MVPRREARRYATRVTVFAGVDLAWSGRKPTGRCVLRLHGGELRFELLDAPTLTPYEVADWLGTLGPRVVAGIDAPLIVSPTRAAEPELARAYGSRGVYAYAARPAFLERHGIAGGPELGSLLMAGGWSVDPGEISTAGRVALEVFPHATTVSLFGAARALRYKRGPRALRLEALRGYERLIRSSIDERCPELRSGLHGRLVEVPASPPSGAGMKELEDRLDAVVCALSVYHIWRHGGAGMTVFGDSMSGYIAVPVRVPGPVPTSSRAPSSPSGRARGPAKSAPPGQAAAVPATFRHPP